MPLDPLPPVTERVAALNDRYRHRSASAVLARALTDPAVGRVALVSSFGAESVALLHMVAVADRTTPVIFLETGMLFSETLAYQHEVALLLGLTDIRVIRPDAAAMKAADPDGTLHRRDPDACCALRKVAPLETALEGFDAWITGRKRFQGHSRAALEFFEAEGDTRIKVNPLAHWAPQDVQDYITNNRLPRHPLVAKGYPSIGCAPCTSPVAAGEDPRAGRWRQTDKQECGIHFVDGKAVRIGPAATNEETPEMTQTTDTPIIVTDTGFVTEETEPGTRLDFSSDARPETLDNAIRDADLIRVEFPSFSDGRGFTIARQLRRMGYTGRLRAKGHVIADQYAMARRSGFDEVEISADLARRQPWPQWQARADWRAHDYQSRLRGQ